MAKSDLSDWTIDHVDDKPILFYCNKCYVPQDLSIQREIVARYHDAPTAGHPGELETYNALRTHYWWPGMRTVRALSGRKRVICRNPRFV